jgi:hypothetical protein
MAHHLTCQGRITGIMTPGILAAALAVTLQQGAASNPPAVTVLRIAAGPSGVVRNDEFVLTEERAEFDPSHDQEVVVYFQWQGQAGPHRMTAQWKGPDGSVAVPPAVQYESKDRRFGTYWTLNLTPQSAIGVWSIDAMVDGQPGGHFAFELVSHAVAPAALSPTAYRRLMTRSELYTRIGGALVVLERSASSGQQLDAAGAYAGAGGRLYTSVAAIDGADTIVAIWPDGTKHPVTQMIAMNRQQDWIVLSGGPENHAEVPVAAASDVQIGDHVFSMDATTGSRVLSDGAIEGRGGSADSGPRWIMNAAGNASPPGEPVFSEFGDLIGVLGGSLVPGASELGDLLHFRAEIHGTPIIPMSLIRRPAEGPLTPLADLRTRGDLLPAVQGTQNVLSAGFAKGVTRTQTITPADQRQVFSAADKELVVFVTWSPQTRVKGLVTMRLYGARNQVVADSKPAKLDARPGSSLFSSWKIPVPQPPGMYRAEVSVGAVPVWRGFVRITQ